VAAGTVVRAVLAGPIDLHGDSATVIAKVSGRGVPLLAGARFVGTTTASSARVMLRFRAVILADGRQARVEAEGQDEDGAFGLAHGAPAAALSDDEATSVAGNVAQETATDVVSGALGSTIAGRALDRYVHESQGRRRGSSSSPPVFLPAGTRIQVFLHDAVELGR
jgi:hypothetical protein